MPREIFNTAVIRSTKTRDAGGGYSDLPSIVAGSPTPCRFYRRESGPEPRVEGEAGTATVDTVGVCSFRVPDFPVKEGDTVPVPSIWAAPTAATTISAPGTAIADTLIPVASSAGLKLGDLVLIDTDDPGTHQEARIIASVADGNHIGVAALTYAHAAGVSVVRPAMAKIVTIQPYTRSKQCDIEQGAE